MKHHPNCRYLRTPAEAGFTMLSISAHERIKQCNHCGAFERAGSPIMVVDFADLLPRRKGHVLALVVGLGPLRWMSTLQLTQIHCRDAITVQIEYDGLHMSQPYCPVRFLPFYDIHAYDRGRKHEDS